MKKRKAGSLLLALVVFAAGFALPSSAASRFPNTSRYVNVRDYGAVGDAVTNDTQAVQKALNAAKADKLTVFFPAGLYRITESLTVPAGVGVEGVSTANNGPWQNLYDGEEKGRPFRGKSINSDYLNPEMYMGSWILAANGAGNPDAGATLRLLGSNTVRCIGFVNLYCPPIDDSAVTPTPPVIGVNISEVQSAGGITVEDVSLANPYFGIAVHQGSLKHYNTSSKLGTKSVGKVVIRNIMGAAMYRGISVIGVNDPVEINNVQFNYTTYKNAFITQHWNECVDIDIAASKNVTVTNVLSFGAYTGLQTSSAFSGSPVNLTARNLNLEGEKPLVLNASGNHTVSNSYFLLTNFANLAKKKNWTAVTIHQDSAAANYTLNNIVFQDSIGGASKYFDVKVKGNAKIELNNATMWNWSSNAQYPIIQYEHISGSKSSFIVRNLGLCSGTSGILAKVGGSAYTNGELTFVGGRFPATVLTRVNTGAGAPIKFQNCTRASGGNTLFSN